MSKKILLLVLCLLLLSLTVPVSVWIHTERTRYDMIPSGDRAYKFDRVTGEVWLIVDGRYGVVEGPVQFAN